MEHRKEGFEPESPALDGGKLRLIKSPVVGLKAVASPDTPPGHGQSGCNVEDIGYHDVPGHSGRDFQWVGSARVVSILLSLVRVLCAFSLTHLDSTRKQPFPRYDPCILRIHVFYTGGHGVLSNTRRSCSLIYSSPPT